MSTSSRWQIVAWRMSNSRKRNYTANRLALSLTFQTISKNISLKSTPKVNIISTIQSAWQSDRSNIHNIFSGQKCSKTKKIEKLMEQPIKDEDKVGSLQTHKTRIEYSICCCSSRYFIFGCWLPFFRPATLAHFAFYSASPSSPDLNFVITQSSWCKLQTAVLY